MQNGVTYIALGMAKGAKDIANIKCLRKVTKDVNEQVNEMYKTAKDGVV